MIKMKLKGSNIFETPKFSVFRKRSPKGASSEAGSGSSSAETSPTGLGHADLQAKRLMAFVKGIQVTGSGVSTGFANTANTFTINVDTFDYDNLTFDLQRMSSNGAITLGGLIHEMTELENHVKIIYGVDKPGQYMLEIKYLDIPVPSSPFKIDVQQWNAANAKGVVAFGKGLKRCMAGELAGFQLDTRKSGNGQISIFPDGKDDIPLHTEETKMGYKVQYLPTAVGTFFLRIKFNGKHIPGSPFMITVDKKREIPESAKNLFKRGLMVGSKEKKNDLQP